MEGRGEDIFLKRRGQKPYSERKVFVDVTLDTNLARFVIRDEGPGFDPASLPPPGQPGSLDPEVGRGLVLMRAFMDEVTFNATGNEVILNKGRENPAG
jgi:anti-sigma regulatory factor (Ser/Thr protein kinase)